MVNYVFQIEIKPEKKVQLDNAEDSMICPKCNTNKANKVATILILKPTISKRGNMNSKAKDG